MLREYRLPYREWRRVSRRAYAAQQRDQSEVAGLIAVGRHREIRLEFVRNESDRPCHFEFGWDQFWRARAVIRASGHRYLGMFHSHPISEAIPGRGDLRGARVNSVVLIYDVCGTNARLWRTESSPVPELLFSNLREQMAAPRARMRAFLRQA